MPTICFIIHGIGPQEAAFSSEFQRAVYDQINLLARNQEASGNPFDLKNLHESMEFVPLYWADIGGQEQEDLYRLLYPGYYGNRGLLKRMIAAVRELSFARELSLTLIGDVFAYLGRFQEPIKRKVFDKIISALLPRIDAREPISVILIGHSLGTVILHDLLSSLVKFEMPGFDEIVQKTSVFTMGSPISLFSLVGENAPPRRFRRWINVRHLRDPIAFPMNPLFSEVTDQRISFKWPPAMWPKLLKTHTQYWAHPKVHRLVAEEILDHYTTGAPTICLGKLAGYPPLEVFQPGNRVTVEAGLIEYQADYSKTSFTDLIVNSVEIDVCNVYGGTWARANAGAIAIALRNPGTQVRVCMISPESPALDGLCFLFGGRSREEVQRRIYAASNEFVGAAAAAKLATGSSARLQIYYSMNPPCHGFYRFDRKIYMTPRPTCGDRLAATPLPVLVYRKTQGDGGMFAWMMRDFELLVRTPRDSDLVFDSAAGLDKVSRAETGPAHHD